MESTLLRNEASERRGVSSSQPIGLCWQLAVRRRNRIHFVPAAAVDRLDAEGPYVRLHTADRSHLVRDSVKRLDTVLDPRHFVRIHCSCIVRIDRVVEMVSLSHGEYAVHLADGTRRKLSRTYRDRIDRLLDRLPGGRGGRKPGVE